MLLLACSLLFSTYIAAQIAYIQIQDTYNKPIGNALVKIDELGLSKVTDSNGIVYFDLDIGEYLLDVEAGRNQHFHHYIEIQESEDYTL